MRMLQSFVETLISKADKPILCTCDPLTQPPGGSHKIELVLETSGVLANGRKGSVHPVALAICRFYKFRADWMHECYLRGCCIEYWLPGRRSLILCTRLPQVQLQFLISTLAFPATARLHVGK